MLRFSLMLLTAFFLSLAAPPAQADWSVKSMNKAIDQTNFLVNTGCSGTLINVEKRYILTAAHCVDAQYKTMERELVSDEGVVTKEKYRKLIDGTVTQMDFADGESIKSSVYSVTLAAVDKDVDLAVVQVKGKLPNTVAAKLADSEPERGDVIYIIGNPMGLLYSSVVKGIVSSNDRSAGMLGSPEENRLMQVSAGVIGGNSGGSVYNSEGELVGVPVMAHRTAEVLGFAVPLGVIKKFLADKHLDN